MIDIALVICTREENGKGNNNKFFWSIVKKVVFHLRKKELADELKEIQLYEDLKLHIIGMPFSLQELKLVNKNKITRYISDICFNKGINSCIIPIEIFNVCRLDGFYKNPYSGRFLFKSLLINILDDIYSKREINIGELDITVIRGQDDTELYSIIEQLSPLVKYLNIFTENKNVLKEHIDEICREEGLSIGLSEELGSAIRKVDLIINLRDSFENIKNIRIDPKTTIVNYGGKTAGSFFDRGTLINGIEVGLPKKTFSWLDKNIMKYFNSIQIAEIILSHVAGLQDKAAFGRIDEWSSGKLSKEFLARGFKISNYIGRHGKI